MPVSMIVMMRVHIIIIFPVKPPQTLYLGQHQLQELLAADQIQMPPDAGVLGREPLEPAAEHLLAELGLDLAGEPGVEVVQHLDVKEQDRGLRELGGDGIQKHFGAVVLVFQGLALARLDGHDAHVDDVGAVAEEDGFAACFLGGELVNVLWSVGRGEGEKKTYPSGATQR